MTKRMHLYGIVSRKDSHVLRQALEYEVKGQKTQRSNSTWKNQACHYLGFSPRSWDFSPQLEILGNTFLIT